MAAIFSYLNITGSHSKEKKLSKALCIMFNIYIIYLLVQIWSVNDNVKTKPSSPHEHSIFHI